MNKKVIPQDIAKTNREKKWHVLEKLRVKSEELRIEDIITLLLENRGITTKEQKEEFINPDLEKVTPENMGIDLKQLKKAITRITKAIEKKGQIVVFGDYDVDGICGSAILWETLHSLGATVIPYIPHRIEEGYGLSIRGIDNLPKDTTLIITTDNGIVANKAVDYAKSLGIDVIITDHHIPGKKVPDAYAIVHTTKLCGAGVAYLLSQEIKSVILNLFQDPTHKQVTSEITDPSSSAGKQVQNDNNNHLELVALASIADLVPLTGASRTLTKFGLQQVCQTNRIGLLELFAEAGLDKNAIGAYEVGHIIAPRLNAMGRIESAMDSLRLLCTKNQQRASELAFKLGSTNRQRQLMTEEAVIHAKNLWISNGHTKHKIIILAHESYEPGVIGLVAGKMVEEYYLPAIVLSKGKQYSKASARSIAGVNIIETIRLFSDILVDTGGHPMAAGFTIETEKIELLQERLEQHAIEVITENMLVRTIKIDCELPLSLATALLYDAIHQLEPFGMGNPEPVFMTKGVTIKDIRKIGKDAKHIKLVLQSKNVQLEAIGFNLAEKATGIKPGDTIDIAYTIDKNTWNGNTKLQMKIKDIKNNF